MREMKNSGVEWIGEIPGEWIRTSLLNVLSTKISDGPHETPILLDKGIPFISVDSLNNSESIDFSVVKKFISEEDYLRYYKKASLTKGDILFSKAATIGKTAIVGDEKFMVWSPIAIIKTNMSRCNNKYIYYILNCSGLIKQISLMGSHNTQINVGMRELEKVQIPVPSLPEQHRIADFLDEKCAKIDAVIEKQKQVIEKLKEYKLSVITEAVTKGLDPIAPMKDSGVEWIGEIPEEWNLVKLKYAINKIGDIDHYMPESVDEGIPYLMTGDLKENVSSINFNACKKVSAEDYQALCKKMSTQKGDIIFARYATIGTVAYVDVECDFLVSYSCVTIRVNKRKLNGKYLFFYLKSKTFFEEVKKYINANTQGNVGIDSLNKVRMPLPPIDTQKTVVDYIERKSNEIDLAIAKKQVIVEKLTEYKKSLIYEVVTGKREV